MSKLTVHWGDRQYILEAEKGQRLLDVLAQNEITVYAPCKGNGSCKKCRVSYLISGETREVLSCQTLVTEDAEVWVPKISGGGVTDFDAVQVAVGETGFGAAVDIGTTTIAAALVDLSSGQILDKCAVLNPQHVCGSDVLSRIVACSEGKLELQTSLVRKEIADILSKLCLKQGVDVLNLVTVCGNTTMLHLFCGVDPAPIGVFPFTPVFTELRCLDGVELGIPAQSVYVLPSASGYIGSDIICGILSQELDRGEVSLLADLGTNGELALFNGKELVCSSTAAGPALEGANIECGIGGIPGAICGVSCEDDNITLRTIGDLPPVGICGSGLVDLMALLLERGIIDETGCFDDLCEDPLAEKYLDDDRFMLTEELYLSQKDVRQFQLAKAAISAGILTLCEDAGVSPETVRNLYIAGGLGFYLPQKSALGTGIIPADFEGKVRVIGNSGLAGAMMCLNADMRDKACKIAASIRICELNNCSGFSDRFVEAMCFE